MKHLVSLIFLLIITNLNSQTEIKFNLASSLFLVPNIGIEVPIN